MADPQRNLRYSLTRQKTRMGFLPTGASLKISTEQPEIVVQFEKPLVIPVTVYRDVSLSEPLTLTLVSDRLESSPFSAASQSYGPGVTRCEFTVDVKAGLMKNRGYPITVRATLLTGGQYPAVSEITVIVGLR